MRIETPGFAFDLPDGFVPRPEDDAWSAINEATLQEITASSLRIKVEADVDEVLRRLAEHRVTAMRKMSPGIQTTELRTSQRDGHRIASFMAAGSNPLLAYTAMVVAMEPVLGQRCLATICVFQYPSRNPGAPDVAAFERFASSIASTVDPSPARAALKRSETQGDAVDRARLYPYLIPESYLETRAPGAKRPRALGHGIYLALAEDFDGAARIHVPEDLGSPDSPDALIATACANLAKAASDRRISFRGFQGPRSIPAIIAGPEWLAASCLMLPNLRSFAARLLGDGPLCASVPHRDAMIIFREEDAAYRAEMRALIARNEAGARKPLTDRLFRIADDGVSAMD